MICALRQSSIMQDETRSCLNTHKTSQTLLGVCVCVCALCMCVCGGVCVCFFTCVCICTLVQYGRFIHECFCKVRVHFLVINVDYHHSTAHMYVH